MGEKVVEMCAICVDLGEMVIKSRQMREAGKAWRAWKAESVGKVWEKCGKSVGSGGKGWERVGNGVKLGEK